MNDPNSIDRANSTIKSYGEPWKDPKSGLDYLTVTVEGDAPEVMLTFCPTDRSLPVIEDFAVILRFDETGRLTKGNLENGLRFLSSLLDQFEQQCVERV